MRVFTIAPGGVRETSALPDALPASGFVWIACERSAFEQQQPAFQHSLNTLTGGSLVDLHVSDLLNPQLPSHFDYTSAYDILVFRRLAAGHNEADSAPPGARSTQPTTATPAAPRAKRSGPPALRRIDTSPVGFAVFDRVVLTVHPARCNVLDHYATRLLSSAAPGGRAAANHLPASPADLMLRVVHHMVDGYLDLRRDLTRQLDHWQAELLHPHTRFNNWGALLDARIALHQLDDICEDQRSAVLDWIESLANWAPEDDSGGQRGLELLRVRSRDVLEHIERVVHHVRRLEQNAETAVQMHFSAQSNRANDIMRTLTVLTAIFLPLNLIAGIFGMNFDFIPLIHQQNGFWWAVAAMGVIAVALSVVFWRKRYLERSRH